MKERDLTRASTLTLALAYLLPIQHGGGRAYFSPGYLYRFAERYMIRSYGVALLLGVIGKACKELGWPIPYGVFLVLAGAAALLAGVYTGITYNKGGFG